MIFKNLICIFYLFVLSIYDAKKRILPDTVLFSLFLTVFAFDLGNSSVFVLEQLFTSFLITGIFFLIFVFWKKLGFGDVKLAGVFSYILGFFGVCITFLCTSLLALFYCIVRKKKIIPLCPFFALGFLIFCTPKAFCKTESLIEVTNETSDEVIREVTNEAANQKYSAEFRNQNLTDILYGISELFGVQILWDETIYGTMSFHFEEATVADSLNFFCKRTNSFFEEENGTYFVSRLHFKQNDEERFFVEVDSVHVECLIKVLAKKCGKTILFDNLPTFDISLHEKDISVLELLSVIALKLPGFSVEQTGNSFFIGRALQGSSSRSGDFFTLTESDGLFSVQIRRALFKNVIEKLFFTAKKEYSLFSRQDAVLENISYSGKTFEELLRLILLQGQCDFYLKDNLYCIFEIQKKDILKHFKTVKILPVKYGKAESIFSLIPQEMNASSFVKIDSERNALILSGSTEEILPIEKFISSIDEKKSDLITEKILLNHISVKDFKQCLPKSLIEQAEITEIEGENSILIRSTPYIFKEILDFAKKTDSSPFSKAIKLKYINSKIFIKNLPPSVKKEDISETPDSSVVFFTGTKGSYENLISELKILDSPKTQITYHILVLQRQKTNANNFSSNFTVSSIAENSENPISYGIQHSSVLSNVLGINFDVISKLGLQFATTLNAELSSGKSRVLADTTLNALSGEAVTFSNTNTYRYRDIIVDTSGDLYTSTTREISSGLVILIDGWVSGDGMITVKIDAQVSKQGTSESSALDTANPPATSEKKVSTNVRTKSGESVVIGGLFQQETDVSEKRVPFFSSIPLLGKLFRSKTEKKAETEFVIYLVPVVEQAKENDSVQEIHRLYRKFCL